MRERRRKESASGKGNLLFCLLNVKRYSHWLEMCVSYSIHTHTRWVLECVCVNCESIIQSEWTCMGCCSYTLLFYLCLFAYFEWKEENVLHFTHNACYLVQIHQGNTWMDEICFVFGIQSSSLIWYRFMQNIINMLIEHKSSYAHT